MYDAQVIIDIILAIAAGAGGWLMKMLNDRINDNKKGVSIIADKVQKIELLVAGNYVRCDKFDGTMDKVFAKLDAISEKLERHMLEK